MASLKETLVSGFKWIMAGRFVSRLLTIATTAILARRLEPNDFGVFALAYVAIDGLQLFQTVGLNSAIIQRKELSESAKHTTFVMLTVSGSLVTIACYFLAPVLAGFFDSEAVKPVIQSLSALFAVGCISRVPHALLVREMRYQTLSIIDLTGAAFHSFMAITLVFIAPSVWTLVLAALARSLLTSLLYLRYSGYTPRWQFDRKVARELLGYGRFMMGVGILNYIWLSLDSVVMGRVLGTARLGYFTLAAAIADQANKYISLTIGNMMFPAFSRIQDEPERLTSAFLKSTRIVAVFSIPFGAALMCLAEPLVLTFYGDGWQPTIILVRLLGIASLITPLTTCAPPLFRACGAPQDDMKIMLARVVVRFSLLVWLSSKWGLVGAAIAGIIAGLVFTPVTLHYVRRYAAFAYRDLIGQLLTVCVSTAVMAGTILSAATLFERVAPAGLLAFQPAMLLLLSVIGGAAFAATLWLVDRPLTTELTQMLRSKLR